MSVSRGVKCKFHYETDFIVVLGKCSPPGMDFYHCFREFQLSVSVGYCVVRAFCRVVRAHRLSDYDESPTSISGVGDSCGGVCKAFEAFSKTLLLHFDDMRRWQFAVTPFCFPDDGFGQLTERYARHGVFMYGYGFAFVAALTDALHDGYLRQ